MASPSRFIDLVFFSVLLLLVGGCVDKTTNVVSLSGIYDAAPELSISIGKASDITYSWDGGGNISGCKNCSSFVANYGEISEYDDAVAVWHFNENFGSTAYDDSKNNITGDIVGVRWVGGRFGTALEFKSISNDYVEVPNRPTFNAINNITLFAWIKPSESTLSAPDYVTIVEKFQDSYGLYILNGVVTMLVGTNVDIYSTKKGGVRLTPEAWYCVAGTSDGRTLRTYVNGSVYAQAPVAGVVEVRPEPEYPLTIGGNAGGTNFDGAIDEVALFNKTLSALEISRLCSKSMRSGRHRVTVYARNSTGHLNVTENYFTVGATEASQN